MSDQIYEVHPGGLMRCCLASLDEYLKDNPKPDVTHKCRYCANPMRRDARGVWRWDRA